MAASSPKPIRPPRAGARRTLQDERQRLAQRLHDTVCQELSGICFLASAAAHKYAVADAEAARRFTEIADLVQRAGANLAAVMHDLQASAATLPADPR